MVRCPCGAYRAAATAASASDLEFTKGTITPYAPVSRTRLMFSPVFQAIRARGTFPDAAIIAKEFAAVSYVAGECSNSTVNQSNPVLAISPAAVVLAIVSQVPRL